MSLPFLIAFVTWPFQDAMCRPVVSIPVSAILFCLYSGVLAFYWRAYSYGQGILYGHILQKHQSHNQHWHVLTPKVGINMRCYFSERRLRFITYSVEAGNADIVEPIKTLAAMLSSCLT